MSEFSAEKLHMTAFFANEDKCCNLTKSYKFTVNLKATNSVVIIFKDFTELHIYRRLVPNKFSLKQDPEPLW